jgi:hypothetical protein
VSHRHLPIVALLALATGFGTPSSSRAADHWIEIVEVFSSEDQAIQYVMLRMEVPLQVFIAGDTLTVQDANGTLVGNFGTAFKTLAPPGLPGQPILIGTQDTVRQRFGVAPDREVRIGTAGAVSLPLDGGRLCWVTSVANECAVGPTGRRECDCVAYGTFSGSNGAFGPKVRGGLRGGRALRKLTFATNFFQAANGTRVPLLLDNCRDWIYGPPLPANSSFAFGHPSLQDADEDTFPDALDNCPETPNPEQFDSNLDGRGDACEDAASPADPVARLTACLP